MLLAAAKSSLSLRLLFYLIFSNICRSALGGDFKSALTVVALEEAIK